MSPSCTGGPRKFTFGGLYVKEILGEGANVNIYLNFQNFQGVLKNSLVHPCPVGLTISMETKTKEGELGMFHWFFYFLNGYFHLLKQALQEKYTDKLKESKTFHWFSIFKWSHLVFFKIQALDSKKCNFSEDFAQDRSKWKKKIHVANPDIVGTRLC